MFIRDLEKMQEIIAGDGSYLRELFNPLKDDLELGYSLAHARVAPGGRTLLHRMKTSEVYYIIEGYGEVEIDGERRNVGPGHAVYMPPGSAQRIQNTGASELVFICMVDPAWRVEDEERLE